MKILRANQRCYWCTFCPPKTTKATHRATGGFDTFACLNHLTDLQSYELKVREREEHITDADRQTWLRL